MTLCVADNFTSRFVAVCDTRVTFKSERKDRGRITALHDTLKFVILDGATLIGFAGEVDFAAKLIRQLLETGHRDPRTVSGHALRIHLGYERATDFLIATIGEGGQVELLKVANGCIAKEDRCAWIGSKSAYDVYSIYEEAAQSEEKSDLEVPVGRAFDRLVASRVCPEVGQSIVSVVTSSKIVRGRTIFTYGTRSGAIR